MCRAFQELQIAIKFNENTPVIRRLLIIKRSDTFEFPLKAAKFFQKKNQEKSLKFPNG
jgi:hypothetical protein